MANKFACPFVLKCVCIVGGSNKGFWKQDYFILISKANSHYIKNIHVQLKISSQLFTFVLSMLGWPLK